MTQRENERMARVETLLEEVIIERLDAIEKKLSEVADKAGKTDDRLSALENKGKGILIGVGLVFGTAGAAIAKFWNGLFG